MLQISQTENPRCSATIDQMRLRWAMALPLDFQNVSSSGFQSEIQRVFGSLIENFLSQRHRLPSSEPGRGETGKRRDPGAPSGQNKSRPPGTLAHSLRAAALLDGPSLD